MAQHPDDVMSRVSAVQDVMHRQATIVFEGRITLEVLPNGKTIAVFALTEEALVKLRPEELGLEAGQRVVVEGVIAIGTDQIFEVGGPYLRDLLGDFIRRGGFNK